jgi:hypothetical protein
LRAKLAHERFLLQRRDELWNAEIPSARHFDLFRATHSLTYAAEAAMIAAAAAGPQDSGDWQGRAAAAIDTLQAVNEPLAESLRRRLERYDAIHQPFERWLEIAQRPDYRDTRGTVLPDVLLETRGELIARVRRGFEEAIGAAIIDNQLERGFQLAQQAKALAVGRTLTAEGGTAPEPITVAALLRTRLMSFGLGDGRSIPSRELFIEYFFGPARAWAFYIFAPGDVYQPLMVVELDRAAFDSQCREAIRALQAGHAPEDPGRWLLSGSPDLKQLWGQLEADKQRSERMPRLVISPDGPLCFLPLQAPDLKIAASVVTLPTAAVLFNSRYLDARRDAVLMWECQRGDLTPEPAWLKPVKGSHFLVLWPGAELEIKMGDE